MTRDVSEPQAADPHPDWPIGEVRTVMLHSHGKPLPEGAKLLEPARITDHHRHYGSIIQLLDDGYGLGGEA
jgi:hypothetical protein